ncbi:hypothetical protein EAS54_36260 [Bradyrhizobium guangzhouense]|nr:hypothetical protein EAS54_36260 [Bradyrhizobium guangzhouense]
MKSTGGLPPEGDVMSLNFSAKLAAWLAAGAVVAVAFAAPASADTRTKQRFDDRGRHYYGPNGPNTVYQQGRTRIYVSKRSWLDGGTEVNPGDRKFSDYAFPPDVGYPSFARENLNRPIDRQPLATPADVGGYPRTFPLY